MTIEELIEKHVHAYWKTDIDPLDSTRPDQRYHDFAIELLEMVYSAGPTNSTEVLRNIEKALEELKKGTP